MEPAELQKLEAQLYNRHPAIGEWLRRRAADALAHSGSPAAVQVLARAICTSEDDRLQAIAFSHLQKLDNPAAIDAVCALWAATRHPILTELLSDRSWVAEAPLTVRVLSALKTGHLDVLTTGGAEILKPLLKARGDSDVEIAQRARRCLSLLTNPEAVDALCLHWSITRSRFLEHAILKSGYLARQPLQLRVLCAIKNSELEIITTAGAEVVQPLLIACRDVDPSIVARSLQALRQLKQPEAQEEVCRWALRYDHPLASEAAIAANYAPAEKKERSLFYFLTEQWHKYEQVDFDQNFLGAVYLAAELNLRSRICQIARRRGRVELVQVLCGKENERLGQMTALEWETAIAILSQERRWQEMWQLAQAAPAVWSVQLLRQLKAASWVPPAADRSGWILLSLHADRCSDVSELGGRMRCRGVIEGRSRQVSCLAIAPIDVSNLDNTSLVATGREDGTVVLWRIKTGEAIKICGQQTGKAAPADPDEVGGTGAVCCLAFSPSSVGVDELFLLAAGSDDGTVRLWGYTTSTDASNRILIKEMASLQGHDGSVECLAFSPGAYPLLATGSKDGTVRLWQVPTGEAIATLKGHAGWINCLAIAPTGDLLATGSADGTVRLWHLPSGELLQTSIAHAGPVECLAISPNGELLIAGSWDGTVGLWALPGGESRRAIAGHAGSIGCLAISADSRILATGSNDYTVRLWHLPNGEPMGVLEGHASSVSCLAFSPTDDLLASGSWDSTVRLWSTTTGTTLQELKGHADWIMGLAFSPAGDLLMTSSGDKTVRLWNSELVRLCRLAIANLKLPDRELVQRLLQAPHTSDAERSWLTFLLTLMRWHRRFDVESEAAPVQMTVAEFEMEIEQL